MSFDWRSYQQLAGELLKHPQPAIPQEAYLRSAISRSYYENVANFDIKRATTAHQLAARVLNRLQALGAI